MTKNYYWVTVCTELNSAIVQCTDDDVQMPYMKMMPQSVIDRPTDSVTNYRNW